MSGWMRWWVSKILTVFFTAINIDHNKKVHLETNLNLKIVPNFQSKSDSKISGFKSIES